MDLGDVGQYLKLGKDALDMIKTAGGMLPKGEKADAAAEKIEQAEKALQASEAQLAKALGYHLCQCTFPPQIMLSKGRHPRHDDEIFECGACGKRDPSEKHFRDMDAYERHRDSGSQVI